MPASLGLLQCANADGPTGLGIQLYISTGLVESGQFWLAFFCFAVHNLQ
jgi:hypothetical protein